MVGYSKPRHFYRRSKIQSTVGLTVNRSLVIALGCCCLWMADLSANETQPNVVFIMADDLGYGDLTCYDGWIKTPNIDSIAADGVNFINGYAANATCAPSRAALMSGRYGTRFGFEFTPTPPGMMEIVSMTRDSSGLREPVLDAEAEYVHYDDMGLSLIHI